MSTFRRELGLMARYRWWILIGALLGAAAIASNVGLMAVSAYLISKAAIVTNVAAVALAITAVRVLAISRAVLRYLERYATHRATLRILAGMRAWFYAAIEPLAPARLSTIHSGDLLARIVADVDTLEDLYVRVLVPPVVAAVVTLAASLLLGAFDPVLGVALAAFLVVTGVVLPLVSRRLTRGPAGAVVAARADANALLVDQVRGVADLLVLGAGDRHRTRTLAAGRDLDRAAERLAEARGLNAALVALCTGLAGVTVLALAIPLVTGGALDGVVLATIPLAAMASFEAVMPLSQSAQLLDTTSRAATRLFELVDAEPEVVDPPDPAPPPATHGLDISGLRFRYGAAEPWVLDGLDLSIPAGGSLALVGPSGAGKSTLVDLLLRFREYREGTVMIGGRDIRAYRADDVRAMLGVVSQRVHLFNATVRDNLAVADAEATDEEMEEACRVAQLHETIVALPEGYETRIGEDGIRLSGGERQRLAIARAVLKDAPILVLDEATANLDVATERRLLESITRFMAGRTTLVISHRRTVADRVDRVVTLAGGRATEAGRAPARHREAGAGGA
ncbi:MAG: thiol reductant ABC exporter subunit CydC [Chloroflexi bacterium]|nr:thiol reductant ABC exporter subunit CydC [Chloroflexota bacterium]